MIVAVIGQTNYYSMTENPYDAPPASPSDSSSSASSVQIGKTKLAKFNRVVAILNAVCCVVLMLWVIVDPSWSRLFPMVCWLFGCGAITLIGLISSLASLIRTSASHKWELTNIAIHIAVAAIPMLLIFPFLPELGRPA